MVALLQSAPPDNVAEVIAAVIIAVLSWWLGRNKGRRGR